MSLFSLACDHPRARCFWSLPSPTLRWTGSAVKRWPSVKVPQSSTRPCQGQCSCPGWEQRGGCPRWESARPCRPGPALRSDTAAVPGSRSAGAQGLAAASAGRPWAKAAGATLALPCPGRPLGPAALRVPEGSAAPAAITCPPVLLGALHRLTERFGGEATWRPIPFLPGPEQRHLPPERAARTPVQPGLQHCRRWGSGSGSFPAHALPPRVLTTTTSGPTGARPWGAASPALWGRWLAEVRESGRPIGPREELSQGGAARGLPGGSSQSCPRRLRLRSRSERPAGPGRLRQLRRAGRRGGRGTVSPPERARRWQVRWDPPSFGGFRALWSAAVAGTLRRQRRAGGRARRAPGPAPPAGRASREEGGPGQRWRGPRPARAARPPRGAAGTRQLLAVLCSRAFRSAPGARPCSAAAMDAAGTADLPPPTAFPKAGAVPVLTPFWSSALALTLRRAQLLSGGIGRLVVTSLVVTKITKVVGCVWNADWN